VGFLTSHKSKLNKKPYCPFGKHCETDSTVCGQLGYYAECPQTLRDDREGTREGVSFYSSFNAVRRHG